MSLRLKPSSDGARRVVVAGGGVAGLEALIGVRSLAGDRVELELISPERTFAYRPLKVAAAFGGSPGPRIEVEEVARTVEATCTIDSVTAVDPAAHVVSLASGEQREYDLLMVAPGANSTDSIPGAISFGVRGGMDRFRKVLAAAEEGSVSRVLFAVPGESGWPLALYELALLTADRLRAVGADVELTVMTPEPAPLAVFGGRASDAMLEELEERRIHFVAGMEAEELAWGELRARPGNARFGVDVVVTLPRLRGRDIKGLPVDEDGFISVDSHGLVRGLTDVYAAGDAIAFPVKHGGLAAQQADAAAQAIAQRVGAAIEPEPFRPVLRGMLLTGTGTRYLEAAIGDSHAAAGVVSSRPLWWPPAKIAGRYLAPYLSGQVTGPPAMPSGVVVELAIDRDHGRSVLLRAAS
jgi:sulfide:quinone oxidoreductase